MQLNSLLQFIDSSCEKSEILKYSRSRCDLSLNYVYWSHSKLFPLLLSLFGLSHAAIQKAVGFVKAGVLKLGRVRINVWSPCLFVA